MSTKKAYTPDLREFYALSKPKKPPCRVGFAMAQLDAQDAVNFEAALADAQGLITTTAISEWLAKRGFPEVSASAVTSHRRRTCTCATNNQ